MKRDYPVLPGALQLRDHGERCQNFEKGRETIGGHGAMISEHLIILHGTSIPGSQLPFILFAIGACKEIQSL